MPHKLNEYLDEQLLEELAESSEDAFRELYERYQGSLLTKAVTFLGCESTAKDCLQDVFVSIWIKRQSLAITNLNHYLHQAVRFRALRWLERTRLAEGLEERLLGGAEPFLASAALECKELRARLERRIDTLPPDQQTIFLLHREQNLTYAQIAQKLNISVKTVEKKMSLALKSLRYVRSVAA
jgi:RNA polymerase sigma-70 factor (ECF subfamily)